MIETLSVKKLLLKILLSLVFLTAVMVFCTFIGSSKICLSNVISGVSQPSTENIDYQIWTIRLQRVILAAIVGCALSSSGVVLQALLRNPLADPYILGISSGAALGAITAVLSGISFSLWAGSPISAFAFAGSLLTIWLVWLVGRFTGRWNTTALLLSGVVINTFFSAVIMFLVSIVKSDQLRTTIYWLMGNITVKDPLTLIISSVCIAAGIIILLTNCHKLNALSLGEQEAQNLGVNINRLKTTAFAASAFITAVAVSLTGLIGFVGLIIPHAMRILFGPDHRQLLPLSAIFGAAFLVIADTIARTILSQEQLPVGVITAIAGGPFFLFLLARYNRKISWQK